MKPKVTKILDKYNTPIKNKNLNQAFEKVDEVKAIAGEAIAKMAKNMQQAEELQKTTQSIQFQAKDFEKNAETLEKIMER